MKHIVIDKQNRRLQLREGGRMLFSCPIALGFAPVGHKQKQGDGKTPVGEYCIAFKRGMGKYGASLALNYPNGLDAKEGVKKGRLSPDLLPLFEEAEQAKHRPPWGTALGGEIYIHGGGRASDWTAGCIALDNGDATALFLLVQKDTCVRIME